MQKDRRIDKKFIKYMIEKELKLKNFFFLFIILLSYKDKKVVI